VTLPWIGEVYSVSSRLSITRDRKLFQAELPRDGMKSVLEVIKLFSQAVAASE